MPSDWDILVLGHEVATGVTPLTGTLAVATEFHGSHAYIVRSKASMGKLAEITNLRNLVRMDMVWHQPRQKGQINMYIAYPRLVAVQNLQVFRSDIGDLIAKVIVMPVVLDN